MLKGCLAGFGAIDFRFDLPSKDPAGPTISIFLHDIQESVPVAGDGERALIAQPDHGELEATHVQCCYKISYWNLNSDNGERQPDNQPLMVMNSVLNALLNHRELKDIPGSHCRIASTQDSFNGNSGFWQPINNKPKLSFSYFVIAPLLIKGQKAETTTPPFFQENVENNNLTASGDLATDLAPSLRLTNSDEMSTSSALEMALLLNNHVLFAQTEQPISHTSQMNTVQTEFEINSPFNQQDFIGKSDEVSTPSALEMAPSLNNQDFPAQPEQPISHASQMNTIQAELEMNSPYNQQYFIEKTEHRLTVELLTTLQQSVMMHEVAINVRLKVCPLIKDQQIGVSVMLTGKVAQSTLYEISRIMQRWLQYGVDDYALGQINVLAWQHEEFAPITADYLN